ncbi:hypothetical protein QJQ58_09575 [Paenibacillus dendritiformis]|uniref:hypothetical protein n=1 Tax=Paenibacillus dendritiformis TaxID=130049 RepID=UPI00248AF768|nr:hypothetical protein [Paenibacillus dendritiformis]WGU96457.1 hypothetical protein QJQ58_09575 [Paenibacillus dendritiformis]
MQFIDHNDFYTSNSGTDLLLELSSELIERIPDDTKKLLILSIFSAALRGANSAKHLISKGFKGRRELLCAFINFLKDNKLKLVYDELRDCKYFLEFFVNSYELYTLEDILAQLTVENDFTIYDIESFIYELGRQRILDTKREELKSYIDQLSMDSSNLN